MRGNSHSHGAGVALSTFAGFIVIVLFTSAIGSYIGRHSTPSPAEIAAPSTSTVPPQAETVPGPTPAPAPVAPSP